LRQAAQAVEDAVQSLLQEGVHAADAEYFRGVRFLMQVSSPAVVEHVYRGYSLVTDSTVLSSYLCVRVCSLYHSACTLCFLRPSTTCDAPSSTPLCCALQPILWRYLRCANAQVRAQAAVFFLDVFPLQHAEGRAEDNDRILQKQFDLLASLLTDSDHNVRAHAALGVCHILKEYWESLPVNTTHNILKYLIDTLSCDASCANVRHAVFVGLNELFQQPLAHAVLKELLPLLQNSIHDRSEEVRVAFIRILCQVRILLLHRHNTVTRMLLMKLSLQRRLFCRV
jgi:hypothetical protein